MNEQKRPHRKKVHHAHIHNLQLRLRMFTQCTTSRTPHFLGANVMHHTDANFPPMVWDEWDGPLTCKVDKIVHKFIQRITGRQAIPDHAMLVAQTSVGKGGLGLVYPSHRAVPDFVLTMISSTRYAAGGGFVFD